MLNVVDVWTSRYVMAFRRSRGRYTTFNALNKVFAENNLEHRVKARFLLLG